MKLEDVLALLNKLGGSASIRQLTEYGRKNHLHKDFAHVIKVRDSLIRLKRIGVVKGSAISEKYLDEIWTAVRKPIDGELTTRKRVLDA
jgi:hypothetical protein